jgi:hypothetical protein
METSILRATAVKIWIVTESSLEIEVELHAASRGTLVTLLSATPDNDFLTVPARSLTDDPQLLTVSDLAEDSLSGTRVCERRVVR